MHCTAIPAFQDNYIWCISADHSSDCLLIDPGCATSVLSYLAEHQLTPAAILITHHHADHVGGIVQLQQQFPGVALYLPALEIEKIPHLATNCYAVRAEDMIDIQALKLTFQVIAVPGHTLGHVAYVCQPDNTPWLFCGDTLFSAGCGRLFEGTAQQMLQSLTALNRLPANTQIYCTHEYTLSNLKFAAAVEPDNTDIVEYLQQVSQLRSSGGISLPSTFTKERAINPFLRCDSLVLQQKWQQSDALSLFTMLRQWKNQF